MIAPGCGPTAASAPTRHDARRNSIRAMGNVFSPDVIGATLDLYVGDIVPDQDVERLADLAYGDDERQVLDFYRRPGQRQGPLLVYIPGGGFDGGDKKINDRVFGNVGEWFAARGVAAAILNYRLAPASPWPSGALDVLRAIEWLAAEASTLGFDADCIWLVGHSAGANHVATALLDRSLADEPRVRGAVLVSGIYEPPTGQAPPGVTAYFGGDPALRQERSALKWANAGSVPIMLAYAEFDPPWLSLPSFELASALTRRDAKSTRMLWMRDHNHVSPAFAFGSGDEALGDEILDFMDHAPLAGEDVL